MEIPDLQNIGRGLPDVKRQPGSSCFKSGSWTSNDFIEFGYRLKSEQKLSRCRTYQPELCY